MENGSGLRYLFGSRVATKGEGVGRSCFFSFWVEFVGVVITLRSCLYAELLLGQCLLGSCSGVGGEKKNTRSGHGNGSLS